MAKRSRAREVALQLLFQRDHNSSVSREDIEDFVTDRLRGAELRTFCLHLFDGVLAHAQDIDNHLTAAAENWRISRMPAVDRNVLRLGAFELLYSEETPNPVAFDEAIELAKRFGSEDSSSFVNGVLDQIQKAATSESAT